MRKEQWKDVAGSPGYHVSSHGRVASQLRGPGSWRLLKACPNNVGYLSVKVPVNGDHKTAFVHRLVAFAFLPPQPTPKHEVNHKDGNKLNNAWVNLRDVDAHTNAANKHRARSDSKTGLIGVQRVGPRWYAYIYSRGKRHSLGGYETPEKAAAARASAKHEFHKEPNHVD